MITTKDIKNLQDNFLNTCNSICQTNFNVSPSLIEKKTISIREMTIMLNEANTYTEKVKEFNSYNMPTQFNITWAYEIIQKYYTI